MNQVLFDIITNDQIAKDVYKLVLYGDTGEITKPGQFVNIKLDGFYLRRPISVCDWDMSVLTLIYKVIGDGTKSLSGMRRGRLDLLCGLGNGYDLDACGKKPLLIGGGTGTPPMYGLCRRLIEHGARPAVALGFSSAADVFYLNEFQKLGVPTALSTVDGSMGVKGFVTDAIRTLKQNFSGYCACGPEPMLKAVASEFKNLKGQLSFEERMACGFGACMGCSCETKYGTKRICKDGPVLKSDEVVW